jgi:hypothetical protein
MASTAASTAAAMAAASDPAGSIAPSGPTGRGCYTRSGRSGSSA